MVPNKRKRIIGSNASNDQEQISPTGPNNESGQSGILYTIKVLSKVIEKKPNDADLFRLRSENFLKLGDNNNNNNDHLQKALQDALKAVELDQNLSVSFRTHLANVYMALADSDKAQDVLSVDLPQEIQADETKMLEVNQALRQIRLRVLTDEYDMREADAEKLLHLPTLDAIKAWADGMVGPVTLKKESSTPTTMQNVIVKKEKNSAPGPSSGDSPVPPNRRSLRNKSKPTDPQLANERN